MTISEAARRMGLRASAIRYYEQIRLLPPAHRVGGQRRYDATILYRLAIIQRARQLGFTLDEIRHLFFGFRDVAPASQRWRTLSRRKLGELEVLMEGIKLMQGLLHTMVHKCQCKTLDQCGERIFHHMEGRVGIAIPPGRLRHMAEHRLTAKKSPKKNG